MCWACTASTLFLSLQLTVLNAGRRYLGVEDLSGKVFVTSGLGGMSGAQAKAAAIVGCIGVIAEVSGRIAESYPCLPPSVLIPEPLTLTSLSFLAPPPRPLHKTSQGGFAGQHTVLPSKCPLFCTVKAC